MTENPPRTISLNEISIKYVHALQRLSDLMVISWAGARNLSEQNYEEVSRVIPGLLSTEFHMPFAIAREESERWWLKQSVNEVLGLAVVFLDDIRKVCGLIAFNAARATGSGDLVSLAAEVNSNPGAVDIGVRMKQLQERYGVASLIEGEILSITGFGRCLFQTNGIVPPGTQTVLHLKIIQPPAPGETQPRLADFQRSWSANEKIELSREEHAAIFTTVSVFFGSILNGVQQFAQRSGLSEETQQK